MNCGVCNHREVCRCFPNPEEYCSDFEPERPHETLESAIDYLTEIGWLPEHDRILTERPQWIPCSERLPEEHYTYLVTIKNASGSTFTTTSYFFTKETGWSHDGIIAWMPFPTPYREEGDRNG